MFRQMAYGDIAGSYTTDKNGRILINSLPAGNYHVIERKALDGYEIDEDVHAVTVTPVYWRPSSSPIHR